MKTILGGAFVSLAAFAAMAAQEPAVSGLSPEPTPASATSLTPVPTPARPALSTGKTDPSGVVGRGGSLADVVKLSKEARKDQPSKKSLGTITNDNVRKGASPTTTPKATSAKGVPGKTAGKDASSPAPTPGKFDVPRDDKGRSEEDWKRLVSHSKEVLVDSEARVQDLETKAKQLENDFYAMSDGNRRDAVVKPAWDKARDDLAKARQEVEDARKTLEDLSEDARKSNAPPGWLR
jgi:hypothetical protein